MVSPAGPVALLTDFGLRDPYVGVMKGVILGLCPGATIVDLSHEVDPQDVAGASFLLSQSYRYFPEGTVLVAVVDPGVGSDRPVVALEAAGRRFLAPDNGLLGFLARSETLRRIIRVENDRFFLNPVSRTFHGRDIFAPVAGHLLRGIDLGELGPAMTRNGELPLRDPRPDPRGGWVGTIVSIDRFGNLVTNIPGDRLGSPEQAQVKVARSVIRGISPTYAATRKGSLLAIVGSTGALEVSVNHGDARKKTGAKIGDPVRVRGTRR